TAAYNIPNAIRLRGRLNRAALESALEYVVARHDILRTTIREQGGVPYQFVREGFTWRTSVVELSASGTPEDRERGLAQVISDEARTPFDLERGPLFRTVLIGVGVDDHALLVTIHHMACDGRSAEVLLDEIGSAYASLAGGGAPALDPLPIQYADFAR